MNCGECGAELIPGKQYCPACGAQATVICSNCRAAIDPGFRYCPDCGIEVTAERRHESAPAGGDRLDRLTRSIPTALAEKIKASRKSVTGERKLVTVLFCDLVGSTALAERLDPEDYRELLDKYLELAFREIYRFEGIVNQLAGDGLMALFGAPVALEDAPDRAVLAALALRTALGEMSDGLRERRGIHLEARIGVHTGPVVVGTVGNDLKMDYTAIGDTTNLAARLQSLARPGMILMSEATHRLVLGFFRVLEVGPLEVKGKRAAVTAYEVIGRRESASPMTVAIARGLTPLVGRCQELAHLQACYERVFGRMPQVVSVVGEDGSGKSRLIYEFRRSLEGKPVTIFAGRCSSLNQMVPYAPFAQMMLGFLDVRPDAPADERCDALREKVRPWDQDLGSIFPYVCRLLAAQPLEADKLSAADVKPETFEAVRRLITGASERQPALIIIEDLHWIDELSRELLTLMVSRLTDSRIMLLVSHRLDFEIAWRSQAVVTRMVLRRLSDDDSRAIVAALAGGALPPELEERVLARVAGNPFFAEEITRALVEDGHILRDATGQVRLARPVSEIPMPDTVQELIGARLDRLAPETKRVAQVAAVLGRQFESAKLQELLEGEGIDTGRELENLERRGIIHRKTVYSNEEFRFGESLTKQVAYESLLHKERRRLHERIAHILADLHGPPAAEQSALVAHHFALGDDRQRAIEALLQAARQAEEVPSYRTAADMYRRAWYLAEEELEHRDKKDDETAYRWALQASFGVSRLTVLYGSSTTTDNARVLSRGRELAEALGDTEKLVLLRSLQGLYTMGRDRDQFEAGLVQVESALAAAERSRLLMPMVSITRGLALGYMLDGRFTMAREKIEWVLDELRRSGDQARRSDVYFGACWVRDTVRLHSDDLLGAFEGATETYEIATRATNRTSEGGSAANLAHVHLILGQYGPAREWAERSLAIAEEIGNLAITVNGAAVGLLVRGQAGDGAGASRYSRALQRAIESGPHMLMNSRLIVEAFLVAGQLEQAERAAELAHIHAGGRLRAMLSASALGAVMARRGARQWEAAARQYAEALRLAEALGARSAFAVAALGAAELAAARGDRSESHAQVSRAVEICRELGLGHYKAKADLLIASLAENSVAYA